MVDFFTVSADGPDQINGHAGFSGITKKISPTGRYVLMHFRAPNSYSQIAPLRVACLLIPVVSSNAHGPAHASMAAPCWTKNLYSKVR